MIGQRRVVCFVICLLVPSVAAAAIADRERAALVALYNSTSGPSWTDHTGWNGPAGTECQWFGVSCDDSGSTVIALYLGDNGMSGTLPAALADLANLQELWLYDDGLTGSIPDSLFSLTKLRMLDLGGNRLAGPIPARFGTMASLTELDLGRNPFGGTIPPELGSLPHLETLRLNECAVSGSIPDALGQLATLQVLDLNTNALTGPVPQGIGNLGNLHDLILYGNRFTGAIPQSIYGLTALEVLRLDDNALTGGLSADIGALHNLQELGVALNGLGGAIPPEITTLAALRELNLYGNAFTGSLPPDIDRLQSLETLDVSDNQLSGALPPSISRMTRLQTLSAYANTFTGTLPAVDALTQLQRLELGENDLEGPLPDLRALTGLHTLNLGGNRFTGTIPDMFGGMTQLDSVLLYGNALTGGIPASLTHSPTLSNLYLGDNRLTGSLPADLGAMKSLAYLSIENNELTGPIPDSFWDLTHLVEVRIEGMALSGTLPAKIANLTSLQTFLVGDNDLSGTIPPEIGTLTELRYLGLNANRLTGPIPPQIGQLAKLLEIELGDNALSGAVPGELTSLVALEDGGSGFGYNRLFSTDAAVAEFVRRKQSVPLDETQTLTPTNVHVTATTDRSATIEWTPITYQNDGGGYQLTASTTPGGTPAVITTTLTKEAVSAVVRGLQPSTTYFLTVAAVTFPHDAQKNLLVSEPTAAVQLTTSARVLAPAEIVVTAEPRGLVQIDGVPQNDDAFDLTNFGDVAASVTLAQEGSFFTIAPTGFTLEGGATQRVIIQSLAQPAGSYWGNVTASGDGTDGVDVGVSLLSAVRPAGTVIADPEVARVEITGLPGTNSVGAATFRNRGTAELTGIAVADVPWIVPKPDPISICAGCSAAVTFTIDRSRRLDANGAVTGTLSLVYVAGSSSAGLAALAGSPPAGVGISTVTVVDTTKPQVGPGTIPAIGADEIAWFVPGLTAVAGTLGSLVSDLAVLNAFGTRPVSDLRLYFTPAGTTQTMLASLGSIVGNTSVRLANIVTNVYASPDPIGSLQVRATDWRQLAITAKLLNVAQRGTFSGASPVFRSDRSVAAGGQLFLPGVRFGGGTTTTVFIQETAGSALTARIEVLDATGVTLAQRDVTVAPFSLLGVSDLVASSSAATVVVTEVAGSAGRMTAYARVLDGNGDNWSVVDWSRYYDFAQSEPMRVPLAEAGGTGSGRRRAVRRGGGGSNIVADAQESVTSTSLWLFNPAATEGRVRIRYGGGSDREVTLPGRGTLTVTDAPAGDTTVLLTPTRGRVVATSRIFSGASGTAVPVIAAQSGLRVGQAKIFSALEDSTAATIAAGKAGTYRTSYGFVETSGARATVRATLLLSDGRSLVSTVVTRSFDLAAGQLLTVPDMVKSIVGADRDSRFPDLHDLQLEVEVTGGEGAVVPFVVVTDNATGDPLLRLE